MSDEISPDVIEKIIEKAKEELPTGKGEIDAKKEETTAEQETQETKEDEQVPVEKDVDDKVHSSPAEKRIRKLNDKLNDEKELVKLLQEQIKQKEIESQKQNFTNSKPGYLDRITEAVSSGDKELASTIMDEYGKSLKDSLVTKVSPDQCRTYARSVSAWYDRKGAEPLTALTKDYNRDMYIEGTDLNKQFGNLNDYEKIDKALELANQFSSERKKSKPLTESPSNISSGGTENIDDDSVLTQIQRLGGDTIEDAKNVLKHIPKEDLDKFKEILKNA